MQSKNTSNRDIIRSFSLFASVHLVQLLISVVRSKVIAVWLGPTGMGINGLLNTTLNFTAGLFSLGIGDSAVKTIATTSTEAIQQKIQIVRVLMSTMALLAFLVMLILSPWLSLWVFDDRKFTWTFVILAFAVFFKISMQYKWAILQGLKQLKILARIQFLGSIAALAVALPLYYFWGIEAIVVVISLTVLILFISTQYLGKAIFTSEVRISFRKAWAEGKSMIKLGLAITLGGLLSTAAYYTLQMFVQQRGGLTEVGLLTAGFTILSTYFGVVFSAITVEYYPRLSALQKNDLQWQNAVGQQAEIVVNMTTPLLVVLICYAQYILQLLYSNRFTDLAPFLAAAAFGLLFKGISHVMAYVILAKGAARLFFINELIFNLLYVILLTLSYHYHGLAGLGVGYSFYFLLYVIGVGFVIKKWFAISLTPRFFYQLLVSLILVVVALYLSYFASFPFVKYLIFLLVVLSLGYYVRKVLSQWNS